MFGEVSVKAYVSILDTENMKHIRQVKIMFSVSALPNNLILQHS